MGCILVKTAVQLDDVRVLESDIRREYGSNDVSRTNLETELICGAVDADDEVASFRIQFAFAVGRSPGRARFRFLG